MKNRVLSGKLFDMECTHCHSKFHIPYPVLYHDMEKKLLIQFTEEKELEPIKKILDHANVGKDYTVRIVDNCLLYTSKSGCKICFRKSSKQISINW